MKKCFKCGNEVSDTAKFCSACGTSLSAPVADTSSKKARDKACPECLKRVALTAKFCNYCGHRFTESDLAVSAGDEGIDVENTYITWHVMPGQLAVKIDETDLDSYGNVNGLYVTPGTKALFFVDGKFAAELDSGKYNFKDFKETDTDSTVTYAPKKEKGFIGFLKKVARFITGGNDKITSKRSDRAGFYSIVLVKGNEFPLIFDFKDVSTSGIRSDVGLHLLCKIENLNSFFEGHMADRKFVTVESFARDIVDSMRGIIDRELTGVSVEEVSHNEDIANALLQKFRETMQTAYPYVTVTSIIDITSENEALENIRKLKEQLYVDEKKLEQDQRRNDFLNRLQNEEHRHALNQARSKVDFDALMDKVNMDRMMNEDEKARFTNLLISERVLREARTKADVDNAMDQIKQTRMLSEEELARLQRAISHRAGMENLKNASEYGMAKVKSEHAIDFEKLGNSHIIAMATLKNAEALDAEKLNWELEIGNKRFENQLNRQKMADDYADDRRDKDYDFQKRKMQDKMDILKQIRTMNAERDEAEHKRAMEIKETEHRHEMDIKKHESDDKAMQLNADIEINKIYAGMTAEQIMAANPNISPEVACAFAEKYKAQAAAEQNSKLEEITNRHNNDLKDILAQQMAMTMQVIGAQNAANARELDQKQAELDRVHADSERHQDRFLDGMKTTISSVASPLSKAAPAAPEFVFCPECGKKMPKGSIACEDCGASL